MRVKRFIIEHREKRIVDVEFCSEYNKQNFITLAIGQNGVGKSFIMSQLAEFFKNMEQHPKQPSDYLKYDYYKVIYVINDLEVTVECNRGEFRIITDDKYFDLTKYVPNRVLALSFMINDKFTFQKNDEVNSRYRYLGIRQVSNASWTTSITKGVSEQIINSINSYKFRKQLAAILSYLSFEQKFFIVYETRRKTLFTKGLSMKRIKEIRHNVSVKRFSSKAVKEISDDDLNRVLDFINSNNYGYYVDDTMTKLVYEFNTDFADDRLAYDIRVLKIMQNLGLIEPPKVEFIRDDVFGVDYASSGEKNIIHTMINLAANIEDGSLIIIDEPELSLHPNWQMKYLPLLRQLFIEYKNCHYLLATHSHFMVSDAKKEDSIITHMKQLETETGLLKYGKVIEYDTYAWSVENILYTIFNVRTSRNHYFDTDVRNLIKLISAPEDNKKKIKSLSEKLSIYVLDDKDPLKQLINESERLI